MSSPLAVVTNIHNFAVGEYSNFKFNSFTYFEGVYLGADDDGIKILQGETDSASPILASMESGALKFDKSGSLRRLLEAYISFRAAAKGIIIGLINHENVENRYKATHDPVAAGAGVQRTRIKLDRGLKYEESKFSINNGAGGALDVISISISYETLTRKSRNDW